MDNIMLHSDVLTILSAIITGGFVLVFVEIGNKKNRETDFYEQLMRPFMNKLSAYFRFINWCSPSVLYPRIEDICSTEKDFKATLDDLGKYGGHAIISGGDYRVGYFNAEQLYEICGKINNVWYLYDRMKPCRLNWDNNHWRYNEKIIRKELSDINPIYSHEDVNLSLIVNVSSDLYTDAYQKIEDNTYLHELYCQLYHKLCG